jgi:peptide/nickel transport system ATP-binding protein
MSQHMGLTPLLDVQHLSLRHVSATGSTSVLNDVSVQIGWSEIVGIIGESGAGKTTLGNAVLGLLAPSFQKTAGAIVFDGETLEKPDGWETIRGQRIAAIFQDHAASLDPLMAVGEQIAETVRATDGGLSQREVRARVLLLMTRVGIPRPDHAYRRYPHQFSGGQRQRLVIAMALAGSPDIIIADEPTSALDAAVQQQILRLIRSLVDESGISVMLITHDMGVVAEITDRVVVMRHGQVVEQGRTADVLDRPDDAYTHRLLAAVPRLRVAAQALGHGTAVTPALQTEGKVAPPLLVAEGIGKSYGAKGLIGWGADAPAPVLTDVSILLPAGKITGIVGESGSGKTTLGRIIAGLDVASAGTASIAGKRIDLSRSGRGNGLLGRVQMIFQDPALSLNPRMTVGATLRESHRFRSVAPDAPDRGAETADPMSIFDQLGLDRSLLGRYPHQLSGGQKQRVCIARALLARPQIIVADEPTSALDVSVQAEIIALLSQVVVGQDLAMLFISHDLAVVQALCDQIYILNAGRIVDGGPSASLFSQSTNPLTRALIEARSSRFTV